MQSWMPCRIHSYLSSYFPNLPFPDSTHTLTYFFFSSSEYPISQKKTAKLGLGVGSGIPYPALVSDLGGTRGRPRAGLTKAAGRSPAIQYCHSCCSSCSISLCSLFSEGRALARGRGPPSGYGMAGFLVYGVGWGGVAWGIGRMGEMWGNGWPLHVHKGRPT